ncbi:cytochrome c oxidase assembly protein [Paenibacillus doosanensis]|uniref:Cytochrome c oxidase caa3 assembly factor (Caa3_CtaG) n=1 Tax=Paenibacillus konkukensis TaxID=2020716 RepID=A0ABY4RNS5_9BACL|nr:MULTISPECIES: cytochrome c oxidase assembly protein [Paenibacillus]MCS7459052.1 cytochrome c oxidase assembly protein [Paenibacillus doosanensis]UQZ84106.1 Cytochrome c oxidase caa3 assembly factor (Caa3_CtaG) [Paenibacillus konkukensis]
MNASLLSHSGHEGAGAISGFATLWGPGVLLVVIIIGWLYGMAVNRWRHRFAESEPVAVKHQVFFYIGLLLYYLAEGSPLSFYGHHYSFSAHMLQQSILYLIMPPFILLGLPGWMLRPLLKSRGAQRAMQLLTAPLGSLFVFNMVFSFYHIPMIMDALMANSVLHDVYNTVFLLAAFQMWFPVFCPLPEYNKMSELWKMAYIFVNGILLTPACALIIFASEPMYANFKNVSEQYLFMSVLNDQQLGGVIMKIIQEIVYGIALAYTFFRWYRRERRQEEEEDLQNESFVHSPVNANRA